MKALSKETRNRDLREELKENSKNYETIAIELLNQCYYDNAKLAQRVVIAAVSELNDRTCLDMVFHSHLLKFMSGTKVWWRKYGTGIFDQGTVFSELFLLAYFRRFSLRSIIEKKNKC